jgi:CheY-like chemotaxis protein
MEQIGVAKLMFILLVEDSRFLRKATERILLKAGYNVVTAGDGEEALRLAFAARPDLILLDMLLPKLSGPEVLRALRKNPITQKTPIIVMSGLSQSNEAKLKKEGADAYLQKCSLDSDSNVNSILETIQTSLTKAKNRDCEEIPRS